MKTWAQQRGFTIVELLIVVVVIAILAAITIVAYNGIQNRARDSIIRNDLALLTKAIIAAREAKQQTLTQITGASYTAGACRDAATIPDGTDLASVPKTHGCWTLYTQALSRISDAAGINVRGLVDPWGWPYFMDENEGENAGCSRDIIGLYTRPLNSYAVGSADGLPVSAPVYEIAVSRSGFSSCTAG